MRRIAVMVGLLAGLAAPAGAEEALRVAKDVPQGFPMMPLDIGLQTGQFARLGLDVRMLVFNGAAKMQTAMVAGEVDVGVGGGPEMAFIVKGAPEIAVAATAGPPVELGISVPMDSPVTSPAGLKGKRIAISTQGGLSHWLVREFARTQGWGPDGVVPVALGANEAGQLAAFRTHQVDGATMLVSNVAQYQRRGEARLVISCGDYVKDFIAHALFASNALVASNPEALRRFVRGWFETIAWMRGHRAETVALASRLSSLPEAAQAAEYDEVMPTLSADGRFRPAALAALARSFVDVGMLEVEPDMAKLTTEAYLP